MLDFGLLIVCFVAFPDVYVWMKRFLWLSDTLVVFIEYFWNGLNRRKERNHME
jgi:hypothetical protein